MKSIQKVFDKVEKGDVCLRQVFFIKKKFLKSFVVCTSYHVLCEKNIMYTFAEENLDFFVVLKQFQYTLGCKPIEKRFGIRDISRGRRRRLKQKNLI